MDGIAFRLRLVRQGDAEFIFGLRNDPRVNWYTYTVDIDIAAVAMAGGILRAGRTPSSSSSERTGCAMREVRAHVEQLIWRQMWEQCGPALEKKTALIGKRLSA